MHEIHGGSVLRLNDDLDIKTFIGGPVPDCCLWLAQLGGGSLSLTICEFIILFCASYQYVDYFDCFPVMIQWISEEAST